jgi:hypothetical protein
VRPVEGGAQFGQGDIERGLESGDDPAGSVTGSPLSSAAVVGSSISSTDAAPASTTASWIGRRSPESAQLASG